jgi:hypothetical protein
MLKSFSNILLSLVISSSICLPSFSQNIEKNSSESINENKLLDIENSYEFQKRKAEIKYTRIGSQIIREVYINGFRVNDQNLPNLIKDKELEEKINSSVNSKRTIGFVSVGLGVPISGLLLYMASTSREALNINNNQNNLGQFNSYQQVDPKTFIFGTLGTIATLYTVVNSISLINDMTGINSPQVLNDKDVENVINKYNENLKNEILKKVSNNLLNSSLSEASNNIMILNVNKSF